VSATALWTAAERARESTRPNRLIEDPFAAELAGEEGLRHQRFMDERVPRNTENPFVAIQTRFFDDYLLEAAASGIRQVVLVAAGMDSRPFRLAWPDGVRLWELDLGAILDAKEVVLGRLGATPRCDRRPVAADLREPWEPALLEAGYRSAEPAAWLVQGLIEFLEEDQVDRLFAAIAAIAGPGSRLGVDVLGRSFIRSPFMRRWLRAMEEEGLEFRFGTDDPESMLGRHGWQPEVKLLSEVGIAMGRWPLPPMQRGMPGLPVSYLVTATR
jgi:methyltransferase (TIGR00027 family)